ncbi:LolA-like outer membrane lipoprotein chaperone [Helicobacter felis]|uniref:Outer-membrane lipoprotein carrier protein n=1 Tax=Helicobacter felis (strain ATCC 49179 / CCUG 28539 / NCTC 12436 / CS1) TaxID=936155 RepID=E7AB50_HELFC|nr:LolA-like outer membrane lipoprotein chaperone [Helicobacter felis]CBY82810.1 outer-membrane lipoprotein carrier protein [Helicobacter felis ATCC 49179]
MGWVLAFCLSVVSLWGVELHVKTFKAHFKQVVIGEGPINPVYEGELFAKIPDAAKWVYNKPSKKEIYMRDNHVLVYEPRLMQATLTKLDQSLDLFTILKKAKLQKDGRYKTKVKGTTYYFTLQDQLPHTLEFKDKLHNKVEITFSAIQTDMPLEDSMFIFTLPQGVDLVRQ